MKAVMIYAYTKFNLGDDLFIKILCERYPNTNFKLYAPKKYKKTFERVTNLKCYSSENLFYRGINYIFRKIKYRENFILDRLSGKCDAFVYIGGSLFIQGEKWQEYYEYIKGLKRTDQPFYLLGANFGPYKDEEYYDKYKQLFSTYEDVCFREKYSYSLFKDLNNVRLSPDIVFGLKAKKSIMEKKQVIISVIKPSNKSETIIADNEYYNKIRDISIEFIKYNINVILMSFCKLEGDEEACKEILNRIPKKYYKRIRIYKYDIDLEEAINLISESKYVIASRFHSMILGWVLNKSVLPIVYSKKMSNVIDDIDSNTKYININELKKVPPECIYNSIINNYVNIDDFRKAAAEQFKVLDAQLELNENKRR